VGNLTGYHYPNGVDTVYRYNARNRLTNMAITAVSQMAKYDYLLGAAGNRTNKWQIGHVIPTGTWTHVAISYSSSSQTNVPAFYINGVVASFSDVSTEPGQPQRYPA
jgi:YD repeat-containing protein